MSAAATGGGSAAAAASSSEGAKHVDRILALLQKNQSSAMGAMNPLYINSLDSTGKYTILMYCCLGNDTYYAKCLTRLLKRTDIDVNVTNNAGENALFFAIMGQSYKCLSALLKTPINVNQQRISDGKTPLMIAILNYFALPDSLMENALSYLINNPSIDFSITSSDGLTATDYYYLAAIYHSKDPFSRPTSGSSFFKKATTAAAFMPTTDTATKLSDLKWVGIPSTGTGNYYLLGHGVETVSEERKTLPPGYVLLTLTECGMVSLREHDIFKSISYFSQESTIPLLEKLKSEDESVVAASFEQLKTETGLPLRLYRATDTYPNLMFIPYDPDIYSGVLPIPLNPEKLLTANRSAVKETVTPNARYELSVYPTQNAIDNLAKIVNEFNKDLPSKVNSKWLTVTVKELMEHLGPGVYVYPICRSVPSHQPYIMNMVAHISTKKPHIFSNINKYPRNLPSTTGAFMEHVGPLKETTLNTLRSLYAPVGLTRASSNIQQKKYRVPLPAGGAGIGGYRRHTRNRRVIKRKSQSRKHRRS